jgi:tagatose-6-phosphate ketose/aldose isomerase
MVRSTYLNLLPEDTTVDGAMLTAAEISGQPELWEEVFKLTLEQQQALQSYLSPLLALPDIRIILTGAGSSAFIGDSVRGILQSETKKLTQAIATTDLVTNPELFFLKEMPTLLISFARSGNSPESLETINLANACCQQIFHLIITCNKNGKVLQNAEKENYYAFILPEAANDKSLVMTGSFTSMLLSVLLFSRLSILSSQKAELDHMKANATLLLSKYLPSIKNIAATKYERVIFLGSGALLGIARECQLKLQELTDGKVICKYDSFLGFRHGPRVVTNERSLIVYLFSNNDHVFQYEKDLVDAIDKDSTNCPTISVGRKMTGLKNSILDIEFDNSMVSPGDFYFIPVTLIGQLLGFYMAIELGLHPDNPSVSGAINRVVQGVTIYNAENKLA